MPQPLTPTELRAIIYVRLGAAGNSSGAHRNTIIGQIQGLIFALTGEVHHFWDKSSEVLDAAGIPYVRHEDGTLETSDDWMKEHGFDPDGKGGYGDHHPRFSERW